MSTVQQLGPRIARIEVTIVIAGGTGFLGQKLAQAPRP